MLPNFFSKIAFMPEKSSAFLTENFNVFFWFLVVIKKKKMEKTAHVHSWKKMHYCIALLNVIRKTLEWSCIPTSPKRQILKTTNIISNEFNRFFPKLAKRNSFVMSDFLLKSNVNFVVCFKIKITIESHSTRAHTFFYCILKMSNCQFNEKTIQIWRINNWRWM